ncbi:hypothetical protein [Geothrix edaphica]|uniref:Uncharacterized protein n=1 Tax=Geothrix edaphica TaxID=2927976 RepID=A0ABQ5PYB4_9BACT|nr:hypothetical protein [Geothrix edaphica]GLH67159.1 hypothetical protein GETHED_15230 [Geothrix edaphica]
MKTGASPVPAFATAAAGLLLGAPALWLGLDQGAIALWTFGAAGLLQGLPSLVVGQRVREGFGNRGLERERLTLRAASHLLRLLALGAILTAVAALMGDRRPQAGAVPLILAGAALAILAPLWWIRRAQAGLHPSLASDASRTRAWLELGGLLLAGVLLGRWFPWADAAAGLAMGVRLFIEGQALARGTALSTAASCGGCGSCGCG